MTQTTKALQLNNIEISFNGRYLLQNFNLQVPQGEKVVLTGPSGCGKSTLLKSFLGLVIPQQGTIRVHGRILDPTSVWDIRRQIAYVSQDPEFAPENKPKHHFAFWRAYLFDHTDLVPMHPTGTNECALDLRNRKMTRSK